MLNVRPATIEDIASFPLRQDDIAECWSLVRMSGKEALLYSFQHSAECYVGEDSNILCLFGCVPTGNGAEFWILIPAGVDSLPVSFFRKAKPFIDELMNRYAFLVNHAHKDKHFILRLSKWLGFTVDDPQLFGIDQQPFCRVWRGDI